MILVIHHFGANVERRQGEDWQVSQINVHKMLCLDPCINISIVSNVFVCLFDFCHNLLHFGNLAYLVLREYVYKYRESEISLKKLEIVIWRQIKYFPRRAIVCYSSENLLKKKRLSL